METKFKHFWDSLSPEEKEKLAKEANTSKAYLGQVANGHRKAGRKTIFSLLEADNKVEISMFQ